MRVNQATFRVVPWYHYLWVFAGLSQIGVLAFASDAFPYDSLGVYGSFLKYLAYNHLTLLRVGFIAAVVAHVGEALYARNLCRRCNLSSDDTVNWTTQTFLVGFTSLFLLKATLKSVQEKP